MSGHQPVTPGDGVVGSHDGVPCGRVALRDLLLVLRRELLALQDLSTDAQLVMSFALQQASLDPGQWSRAQSLDLITQRLNGLAVFAGDLSESLPPSWMVNAADAVQRVSLSDLANRMACGEPEADRDATAIELF